MSDFFDSHTHFASKTMQRPLQSGVRDVVYDARLAAHSRLKQIFREAELLPPQRVLVVGVEVPARGDALQRIGAELARSRHHVTVSLVPMQPKGKFENVADAIANAPDSIDSYDWLIITDDDVALPPQFTDRYLALAERAGLTISQPAHKFRSHATFALTRRRFGTLVRETGFVEIGPITVIRKDGFADLIPFPPSRWAYGIDAMWAQTARDRGWSIGVIDALPIRHLAPVATGYSRESAVAEGRALLARAGVTMKRSDMLVDHGERLIG